MDAIFQQFLNPEIAVKVFPYLMKGFGTTLLLSLLVIPLGLGGRPASWPCCRRCGGAG